MIGFDVLIFTGLLVFYRFDLRCTFVYVQFISIEDFGDMLRLVPLQAFAVLDQEENPIANAHKEEVVQSFALERLDQGSDSGRRQVTRYAIHLQGPTIVIFELYVVGLVLEFKIVEDDKLKNGGVD